MHKNHVRFHVVPAVSAFLATLAMQPAAKASFIMSPMPASLSSGLAYQQVAPAANPAPAIQLPSASELSGELARPAVAANANGGPGVQDGGPRTILPEPATIAVLGVGLASLAFLRRTAA